MRVIVKVIAIVIAIPVACFLAGRIYQAAQKTKKPTKDEYIDVECTVS